MKKDILHLFMIPFTGLGLFNGYRGDDWFKYRIGIFKKYVLPALLNQTEKDFVLWICFRKEEESNPITKEFFDYLNTTGLKVIFTYGGIGFWDDKYKNDKLFERLKIIIPALKDVYSGEKYVYETIQPSDDFYHRRVAESIQEQPFRHKGALIHSKGYVFNDRLQKLAIWNPATNPPFYTIMYPAKVFFDPHAHYKYIKNMKSHEDVIKIFNAIKMPDLRYCVLIHGNQISTTWYHPFREGKFDKRRTKEIMADFGAEIKKTPRMNYSLSETKRMIKYIILRSLIKGRLYRILKFIKNKYEQKSKK